MQHEISQVKNYTLVINPENFFAEIAGVPVHYDRFPPPCNYGTRGAPHKFFAADEFIQKLNDCFKELWKVCPYGRAQVITSAGAYVDKPGWHGKGMAFDLDGIFWKAKTFQGLLIYKTPNFILVLIQYCSSILERCLTITMIKAIETTFIYRMTDTSRVSEM